MKIIKNLTITALMLMGLTFTAYAQGGPGKGMGMHGNGHKNGPKIHNSCQNIPDLTEEQKNKIEDLKIKHMAKCNEYKNQMMEKRARLHSLTSGDNVDMEKAEQVSAEIANLKEKMLKERINHRNEIRNLLTEEQKVYFDSHRTGHRKMGNKCHRGKSHRPGKF